MRGILFNDVVMSPYPILFFFYMLQQKAAASCKHTRGLHSKHFCFSLQNYILSDILAQAAEWTKHFNNRIPVKYLTKVIL